MKLVTERLTGWRAEKFTGAYVVRIPGENDRKFYSFNEAVRVIVGHKGYAVLIDPQGKAMLTKGTPPKPDA